MPIRQKVPAIATRKFTLDGRAKRDYDEKAMLPHGTMIRGQGRPTHNGDITMTDRTDTREIFGDAYLSQPFDKADQYNVEVRHALNLLYEFATKHDLPFLCATMMALSDERHAELAYAQHIPGHERCPINIALASRLIKDPSLGQRLALFLSSPFAKAFGLESDEGDAPIEWQ